MLTIDGAEAHCPACGSPDVTAVGRDFDAPSLEYLQCVCGQGWRLDTFLRRQSEAPKLARARVTDPAPSQQAARLDFTGRLQQVHEALTALGVADAQQVTDWINAHGYKPIQRNVASRRLKELVDAETAAGDHTNTTADGITVTAYRLTEQARRQAA